MTAIKGSLAPKTWSSYSAAVVLEFGMIKWWLTTLKCIFGYSFPKQINVAKAGGPTFRRTITYSCAP